MTCIKMRSPDSIGSSRVSDNPDRDGTQRHPGPSSPPPSHPLLLVSCHQTHPGVDSRRRPVMGCFK